MKTVYRCLLLLIVSFASWGMLLSQDLVISLDKKGKIGFTTKDGEIVIPHKYSTADPFVNGVSKVSVNGMYGIIDEKGNEVLPLEYSSIGPFKYGVAEIVQKGKKGLINAEYKIIAEPVYTSFGKIGESDYIWVNQNGRKMKGVPVLVGGKRGIIHKSGKVVIPVEKSNVIIFSKDTPYFLNDTIDIPVQCDYFGYMSTYKSTGFAIVDKNSKELLPENKYTTVYAPRDGKIVFTNKGKTGIQQGFYDTRTGKDYVVFSYEGKPRQILANMKSVIRQFHNNRAVVMNNNGEVYIIDDQGHEASNKYDFIQPILVGDQMAYIGKHTSSGVSVLMDDRGEGLTTSGVYSAMEAGKQITKIWVAAQRDGKWGVLDENGNESFPFEYDGVYDFSYDRIKIRKGVGYGLYDNNKGVIIPCEYKDVKQADVKDVKNVWVKKNDGLWYRFNLADTTVSTVGYKDVFNYNGKYAFVKPVNAHEYSKFIIFPEYVQQYVLIDENDNIIVQDAISDHLIELIGNDIVSYLQDKGFEKLTLAQQRHILLELTQEFRSYPMSTGVIDPSQWDY